MVIELDLIVDCGNNISKATQERRAGIGEKRRRWWVYGGVEIQLGEARL